MARKKRRGVTLFELLRKDRDQPAGPVLKQIPGAPQQQDKAAQPQVPTGTAVAAGTAPSPEATAPTEVTAQDAAATPSRLQVDEDGYILHLSRHQTILVAAAAVVILVVVLLIGSRMFRSDKTLPGQQTAQAQDADGERIGSLASLAPPAGSDSAAPDSPVRIPRPGPAEASANKETAEPEQDGSTEPARPMAAARVTTGEASGAQATGLAQGDTRKTGLNYLVIQIIPGSAEPSPKEHAAEVRKFLASKGIRTLAVPVAAGGIKVLSEQGFDLAESSDKDKCEKLIEKVRQAGKEYASARYMGRYNFASPYKEKYSK